jgi:anoctamin-8
VIGNLKESAVPYLIEQLRLARLSFELFGALSPSEARAPPGQESDETQGGKDNEEKEEQRSDSGKSKQPRNVSQAELESSLYRVGHPTNSLLSDVTFKV